jgi:adenosylmethionine-8-amino-7-oxononanoate aminotransferase
MGSTGPPPLSLWHPFADMGAIERAGELVISHGDGAYVYDIDGRRYFDSTASLWYANVGWGRTEIADAVAEQLRRIPAYSNFGDTTTGPTIELAEKLASIAPVPGSKVFFTSGGSTRSTPPPSSLAATGSCEAAPNVTS